MKPKRVLNFASLYVAISGMTLLSMSFRSVAGAYAAAPTPTSKIAVAPKSAPAAKNSSAKTETRVTDDSSVAEVAPAPRSATVADSIKAYKAQPDSEAWDKAFAEIYALMGQSPRTSPSALVGANPSLNDVGARCVEGGGARVWTFTKVPDNQSGIVLWQNIVAGPEQIVRVKGRKRVVRGEPTVSWKGQMLRLPSGLSLKDARLVHGSAATALASAGLTKPAPVDCTKSLILSGMEKNGNTWLHGFRLVGGNWTDSAEIFSGVPPFLLQNLAGKVAFSGNDLVVSVGMPVSTPAGVNSSTTNGYKLVLRYAGGKYVLEGKSSEDGPLAVAQQFAMAVAQNRVDLAKGWLGDAKLISIPLYAGLLGHTPLKVMPMANPGNGNSRFRLVSFAKEDLIVDIGKVKTQQLAVKAIYVAPSDPLAQKLLGNLTPPAPSSSSSAPNSATPANADVKGADAK